MLSHRLASFLAAIACLVLVTAIAHGQQQPPQRRAPPAPSSPPPATQPAAPAKPSAQEPPILGLPRVGEEGATAEDVEVLQRAARKFLADGRCKRIDYGDRSMSRMGWYIISCDGHNIGFRREDLEN